jgi:isopenicillin N synthase-like dioxygenase
MPPPPPPAAAAAANDGATNGDDDDDGASCSQLPTIDLASYGDLDNADSKSRLARDLRQACETVGFFYLENHGVGEEVFAAAFDAARRFFALPDERKQPCRASASTKNRGWTPLEAETLDPKRQKTRGDLKEGFYVGREIGADSKMASLPLHGPNVWPDEEEEEQGGCRGFRAACEAYHAAMMELARRLLPAVAEAALGDESGADDAASRQAFVDAVFGEHGGGGGGAAAMGGSSGAVPYSSGPMAFVRLLQYAPVASVPRDDDSLLGCGAHSDWGMLTLLATDGSEGLQVLRRRRGGSSDGSYWQDVPPRRFPSLVVNVGDMLERWTAGRLRSTVHRVVVPEALAAKGHRRQSIAFFLDPSFSALIAPVCGGGGEYAPVRAGDYLLQRYGETHAGFAEGA